LPVLSLVALLLWMIAIPCFMAGMVWLGLGVGVIAFAVTRAAVDRRDDMETLFGLGLQALLVIAVIRGISALLP
jgi:multisubunit Na+/H+ antiporter MnhE subunit